MSEHLRSPHTMKREVSAEGGQLWRTLVNLWPYIWPSDRRDLQRRVLGSLVLHVAAKPATIAVPFTFKFATDGLAHQQGADDSSWIAWVIATPLLMTAGYGGTRILMAAFTQMRDGVFAKVSMHAVRRLAILTFEHMHRLSLRFHLERKTGGLTRVLERGRNAIETIVRMVILQLVPTILEVLMVAAVLLYQFDWRYVVVIAVTVAFYMLYTYYATEWRIGIRRKMNESDSDANTKAIDSLLNYETVKYVSAEARETARYDRSMARYEQASVQAYVSLAVLNAGQATIFTLGLTVTMGLCVYGIRAGTHTIGDFVMINAMMIQLYQPLNFMGMVYREIKQAVIDIEQMFTLLGRDPEIKDKPGAEPLAVKSGTVRYNIRYGRWDASDAEVEQAAALAQIDAFIRSTPKGYDTEVGERGLKLSGGEKQRVAIARTILKAPPILLLDEATSALDSHTEQEIQDALDRVSRNRTTLVIAHRLSTIIGADEIIVLDQGSIVERGAHQQLLAAGGLYASMWNRQREAEAAREKLALVDDEAVAPNRDPPVIEEQDEMKPEPPVE